MIKGITFLHFRVTKKERKKSKREGKTENNKRLKEKPFFVNSADTVDNLKLGKSKKSGDITSTDRLPSFSLNSEKDFPCLQKNTDNTSKGNNIVPWVPRHVLLDLEASKR